MKKSIFLLLILFLATTCGYSQERFRSGIFLHHSTGANIWGPNGSSTSVPDEINNYNNEHQFTGDQVCSLNEKWFPANHGNEWADWHHLFDKDYTDDDIWPLISANKIVIIKSCFPSSAMTGWGEPSDTNVFTTKSVYNYKWHWRHIIRIMESHPENFFVIWTNAPLVAGATNDDQAYWSHVFCTWAKDTLAKGLDPEYGEFPKNVYVFDYFHKLVGNDYKEKPEYAKSNTDSHPNAAATELAAPQLVQEVFDAAVAYEVLFNGELKSPLLIYPENNRTDFGLDDTLIWQHAEGASRYHLQVSLSDGFLSPVIDTLISDTIYIFSDDLSAETTYYWRVAGSAGGAESEWSEIRNFTTEDALRIKNNKISDAFLVYPNPSSGKVYILFGGKEGQEVIIEVFNGQGVLVKTVSQSANDPVELDIQRFPPGVYFLRLYKGGTCKTGKIFLTD